MQDRYLARCSLNLKVHSTSVKKASLIKYHLPTLLTLYISPYLDIYDPDIIMLIVNATRIPTSPGLKWLLLLRKTVNFINMVTQIPNSSPRFDDFLYVYAIGGIGSDSSGRPQV